MSEEQEKKFDIFKDFGEEENDEEEAFVEKKGGCKMVIGFWNKSVFVILLIIF